MVAYMPYWFLIAMVKCVATIAHWQCMLQQSVTKATQANPAMLVKLKAPYVVRTCL